METGILFASFFFGTIGMGMFTYGYKTGRMVPMGAGGVLMVVTYFIPNLVVMLLVCSAITAVPWFVRD